MNAAISLARQVLHRGNALAATDAAAVSQLLGRALLAVGREADAEDVFRSAGRLYQSLSRAHVRWLSGLDQGILFLQLGRSQRAAEAFCAVADDARADPLLRAEAMLGAALALHRQGVCASAWRSLHRAQALTDQYGSKTMQLLARGVGLELAALQRIRLGEGVSDHAMCNVYRENACELPEQPVLLAQLAELAVALEGDVPLACRRLQQLGHLMGDAASQTQAQALVLVQEELHWLRQRELSSYELAARIEAVLLLLVRGQVNSAAQLIAALNEGESPSLSSSNHVVDLYYCKSRLSMAQGRAAEALNWYSRHSHATVENLRQQPPRASYLAAPAEALVPTVSIDTACARLPARYRRAYLYIVGNLHDENLSVSIVACQVGVTERALQMAFRTHLGMSPMELIRTRRMERIRDDIHATGGEQDLMMLAGRWGIHSRSTLASNYKARFNETPSETRSGRRL